MRRRLHVSICSVLFLIVCSGKAQQPANNYTPEAREYAKKRLQAIREQIKNPDDFYKYAKLYSDDPGSAKNGGCYDSLRPGIFIPEFDKVAFKLKPGEFSDVFESPYGFHLIYLRTRRGDEIDVCHILIMPKN